MSEANAQEPSMEEILASIRRIISDDGDEPAPTSAAASEAFAREDGASMFRFEVAQAKAWGAVGMGASSRTLAQRAKDNPNFFVSLAATASGKFLPQTGAVLIQSDTGHILGAVGASGGTGDEDELICMAGVEFAGLKHA